MMKIKFSTKDGVFSYPEIELDCVPRIGEKILLLSQYGWITLKVIDVVYEVYSDKEKSARLYVEEVTQ